MVRIVSPYTEMVGTFISNLAFKRKIKRYWGTTTVDGVEVFKDRLYLYPKSKVTANGIKFLKLIGAYEQTKNAEYKGVASVWLFLNPDKQSGATKTYFTKGLIASLVEDNMVIDQWYDFNVVFSNREYFKEVPGNSKKTWNYTKTEGLLDLDNSSGNTTFSNMNKEQLKDYIVANWDSIRNNNLTQGGSEIDELDEFAELLFYGDVQDEIEVAIETIEVVPIFRTGYTGDDEWTKTRYTYVEASFNVNFKARRIANITQESDIVERIYSKSTANNAQRIGIETGTYEVSTIANILLLIIGRNTYSATDIWYTPSSGSILDFMGKNKKTYLRVDAFDRLKSSDAIKLFISSIDQDYKKKKTKWYKKLLAIVTVTIVSYLSWGALSGVTSVLLKVAYVATITGLAMAAVGYYAAKSGDYGLAEFAGKIGQISGMLALVAGIGAAIQNIARHFAVQQAARETARQAVASGTATATQQSVAQWTAGRVAWEAGKQIVMGGTGSVWSAFGRAFNFAAGRVQAYQNNKIAELDARSQEMREKTSELEQANMLKDDDVYIASLEPLLANATIFRPLDTIENSYYVEGKWYNPTKYNIQKSGPFQPIGVFKPEDRLT